jgi:hypothetical protein
MDRDGVGRGHLRADLPDLDRGPVLRSLLSRLQRLADGILRRRPDRLIGAPMLPKRRRRRRAAPRREGRRATGHLIAQIKPKLDDPAWNPLAALEDSGIILSWHHRIWRPRQPRRRQGGSVFANTKFLDNFLDLCRPVRLGHPRTPPKLKMVMAEAGGWLLARPGARLPALAPLEARISGPTRAASSSKPSQRTLQAPDLRDLPGRLRGDGADPFFGEGHLLWASDYPHPDSVWPNSKAPSNAR